MPIGGKIAFLSKVTFRRESNWVSKTKQMLKDMKTIEERAKLLMNTLPCEEPKGLVYEAYKSGATEQRTIDIATIPRLYIRWLLIDDGHGFEKPSWEKYAAKAMDE